MPHKPLDAAQDPPIVREQMPEKVMKMTAPEKSAEVRPCIDAGAQHWVCPWCGRSNGIPEITVCACGARLTDSGVEKG